MTSIRKSSRIRKAAGKDNPLPVSSQSNEACDEEFSQLTSSQMTSKVTFMSVFHGNR